MSTYPTAPDYDQLGNLRYPSIFGKDGSVQLRGGSRRMRTAFGSNHVFAFIQLNSSYANGDLDGDGVPDAAIVLVSSPGEVGTFLELHAVLNTAEGLRPASSAFLGEEAQVHSVEIYAGEIRISLVDYQGEIVERGYRLVGDRLAPTD